MTIGADGVASAVAQATKQMPLVESLPKSASGKVLWRLLQEEEARAAAS